MRETYGAFSRGHGRLEYKSPVVAADVTGTAPIVKANGNRVALILAVKPVDGAPAQASVLFSDRAGAAAVPFLVLNEGMPSIILREGDVGDLLTRDVFVVSSLDAASIAATEIIWHPDEE